jgi:hypothetical protein
MQSSCLSGHYFAADSLLALSKHRSEHPIPRRRSFGSQLCDDRGDVPKIGVIGIPTLPGIVEICLNVAGKN